MRMRALLSSTYALLASPIFLLAPLSAQEPNFGRAIVMAERDLLIGQPVNWYGPGVVYAYRLGSDGEWTERSLLTAPDSARKDDFGRSLALDGNTLVVGAPRKRDGSGVAYVFERTTSDAVWTHVAVLDPPAAGDHVEYGAGLAVAGDDILVGSPFVGSGGVVYHFTRDRGTWRLVSVIEPPDEVQGFGTTLSLGGDRVLIGAPAADSARGRVYVADRTGPTAWSTPRSLQSASAAAEPSAAVGSAVLLADGRAYVGAPGSAMVIVLEPTTAGVWSASGVLRPFDDPPGSRFGASLVSVGGDVWVGAPGVAGGDGRVYRFTANRSGGWSSAVRVDPDVTEGVSWPLGFGYALAGAGAQVVVGMPTRDFGEGRAMALTRMGDTWDAGQILEGRIYRIGEALESGDRCREGRMADFPCANMELVAHMPVSALGGERGVWVNDVWGWTDPETRRRYALVARRDGASFVDVTDPASPRLVGNLPRTEGSRPSVWRDIKVIGNHAYIVSDGAGAHGMQVFDLTALREVGPDPVDFEPDTTYHEIFSAHNVVADTLSRFLYVVAANSGGRTCGGGLHMVDVRDPERPAFAGCYHDASSAGSRGYTHDAQCLVYRGPDGDYRGRQLCIGSNESELNIADVTDKASPRTVARVSYPNVAYAHQGWFDEDQRYFYMNDEGDEAAGSVERTRTLVWDLTDLDDPVLANEYFGPVAASDHNLFVIGDRMYQSNYGSGLRVLDISDRENPREIAFFDSAPLNDDEPGFSATQSGAWSNYPFFPDGLVIFTSVREGLFIMRVQRPVS